MTDNSKNSPFGELSFRDAMAELDRTVAELESNTLELEDSLKAYEHGVRLLADLKSRLASAQQKVDVLMGQLDVPADDATTDTTLS